jgi:hypothetical protein
MRFRALLIKGHFFAIAKPEVLKVRVSSNWDLSPTLRVIVTIIENLRSLDQLGSFHCSKKQLNS